MNHSKLEQDELPASVRYALGALKPVPAPDTEAWNEGRLAFIRTAAALAEVRPSPAVLEAVAVPAGVPNSISRVPAIFGKFLSLVPRRVASLKVAWVVVALALLLIGSSVGTVRAARASLPGSPLYTLKVRLEQWDLRQARTPQDVSHQALVQSQKRVEEATRLLEAGEDVPNEVAVRFREQLNLALTASGSLDDLQRVQTQSRISETLEYQIRTMAEVAAKVKGDDAEAVDHDAVTAMVRAMVETQARLGAGYGQESGTHQGEPAQVGPSGGCSGEECGDEAQQPPDPGSGPGSQGDDGPDDPGDGEPDPDPKQDDEQEPPRNRFGPGEKESGPGSNYQNDADVQRAAQQVDSASGTIASASLRNPPLISGMTSAAAESECGSSRGASGPGR